MDQNYKYYKPNVLEAPNKRYEENFRLPIVDLIEKSSLISILQLLVNFQPFLQKLSEIGPPSSKLCGKLRTLAKNLKSNDFREIGSILPKDVEIDSKPSVFLNKILEDFQTCTEFPTEKRPDSLFSHLNNEFTIKVPVSRVLNSKISEVFDQILTTLLIFPKILAIDVVWDCQISCENIFQVFSNILPWKNYDIFGFITCFGCFFTSYYKNLDFFQGFDDPKRFFWVDLIRNLSIGLNFPVLILFNQCEKVNYHNILKEDSENLLKIMKIQDKIVRTEEKVEKFEEKVVEREKKNFFDARVQSKIEENYSNKKIGEGFNDLTQKISAKEEKKFSESGAGVFNLQNYKDFINKPRNYHEKLSESIQNNQIGPEKTLNSYPKTSEIDAIKIFADNKPKKIEIYKVSEKIQSYLDQQHKNYSNTPSTRLRNISNGPEIDPNPKLFYENSNFRNASLDRKVEKKLNSSISPIFPGKETLDSEKINKSEEIIKKPTSILKKSWITEKFYNYQSLKTETSSKKVNFSDIVFKIEDSNDENLRKVNIVDLQPTENNKNLKNSSKIDEYKNFLEKKKHEKGLNTNRDYKEVLKSDSSIIKKTKNWKCPKCSALISNEFYECQTCRFISWEKFNELKSKSYKTTSESVPLRINDSERGIKPFRVLRENLRGSEKIQAKHLNFRESAQSSREYISEKSRDHVFSNHYNFRVEKNLIFHK